MLQRVKLQMLQIVTEQLQNDFRLKVPSILYLLQITDYISYI